ncbi:G8 domain-containing protein [Galbibacter sp. BG1]|uniref:G8 domain-containing protein n=1 Tax=Galbibacter sp. BG1 TaxID=1170699 RepID=UPI00210386D9|nr:G8 domain-containing protein [Galbibacter sp. BG1]
MTSAEGNPGDWGGLLLCGKATTTAGANSIAEVGGLVYGGTDDSDSSGSIDYLTIVGSGAQINADSQYNGLSLYAVGSGTSISNVAIIDGADDGVEFFGGTVSVSNIYLENNQDDAVDWTEGWNGTVTNTYVLHTVDGFSTAVEADGANNNPKLENFTAVSTVGGLALQFKKESGATIDNLSLTGYDSSLDFPDNGALTNVKIEGEDANPESTYTTPPTVNIDMFSWVSTEVVVDPTLLQGTVEGEVTLDASVEYTLNSSYVVQDGGKLIIPAGTKITARSGGTDVYIAVLQGGEIDIQGTPENPVVISSVEGNPEDWAGLTICGKATTTAGAGTIAEIGGFVYGGNDDTDNSGSIKNLVLVGTGAQINSESQYNGISFYSVGSGTVVENIAIINGADDGVEFFGGTVSATNLYLENNQDDSVDWTEGWSGNITNTYVSHTVAGFSTAIEADGANGNPNIVNFTAVSTVDGIGLQFKKQSGATISNIFLDGYATNVDFPDNGGAPANVIIDGTPLTGPSDDVFSDGTAVDISTWTWKDARL